MEIAFPKRNFEDRKKTPIVEVYSSVSAAVKIIIG
jgi:hypothetical protein